MNSELLQTLVYEDFGYKREGNSWGRAEEHSSLVVNEEEQKWFWNSHNMGGGVIDYLTKVRKLSYKKAKEFFEIKNRIVSGVPEESSEGLYVPYEKLVDLFWKAGKTNRDYWYRRFLNDSTIDKYRLGFTDGWYTMPLYRENRFVNFQIRREEPEKRITLWYKDRDFKPILINKDFLNLVDTIYIAEGTVDCLLLTQEGMPTLASTGATHWSDTWFPLFSRVKNIFYIADNDSTGKWASQRVAKSLGVDRVRIFQFKDKDKGYDSVQFFRDGGNVKELKEMVESESKYHFEIGEFNEYKNGRSKTVEGFGKQTRKRRRN